MLPGPAATEASIARQANRNVTINNSEGAGRVPLFSNEEERKDEAQNWPHTTDTAAMQAPIAYFQLPYVEGSFFHFSVLHWQGNRIHPRGRLFCALAPAGMIRKLFFSDTEKLFKSQAICIYQIEQEF